MKLKFLAESTDSISAYWDHLKNEVDFITIFYARKSPAKENDAPRTRLLQLMVDKLYYRMKCEEVYVSPYCFADEPMLERDSPVSDRLISVIKVCNGGITYLTKRIHYTPKNVWLLLTMLAFTHLRMTFENFLKHTPISKKLPLIIVVLFVTIL